MLVGFSKTFQMFEDERVVVVEAVLDDGYGPRIVVSQGDEEGVWVSEGALDGFLDAVKDAHRAVTKRIADLVAAAEVQP